MVIGWSLLMGEKEHPASSSEQKKETAKTILIFCDLIENPPVYFPTWSQQQKHGPRDGTAKAVSIRLNRHFISYAVMRASSSVKFLPSVEPGSLAPLDSIKGLRYNKIKLGAALFIVGRADRALFLFFRGFPTKSRAPPP